MTIYPGYSEFEKLSRKYTVVPVWTEILADLETPVSAFLKVRSGQYSFLLESVEQEERTGRYSFLGTEPELVFASRGRQAELLYPASGRKEFRPVKEPLLALEKILQGYRQPHLAGLPRFTGGFIGYLSYDYVRFLEKLPDSNPDDLRVPDTCFLLAKNLVVFDHFKRKLILVSNAFSPGQSGTKSAYRTCVRNLKKIRTELGRPLQVKMKTGRRMQGGPVSNLSRSRFQERVRTAKEYIRQGDIIQVVLSQRWRQRLHTEPFNIYRVLRSVNPSPYMFFLETGDVKLVGSSPEILVKLEGKSATVRPIAGTRPRHKDTKPERKLEEDLLNDEKERAEHVMLVDLGRNDLGRVCRPGSVKVTELMRIEKYSHVMHLVSNVEGTLARGRSAVDLLRACFPAGTVTGAPKVRAMEIIEELEPTRRGPYAGAVGYFGFQKSLDFCITIRTVFIKDETVYFQAGAGIVADSVPEREYRETANKAAALMEAYRLAGEMEKS